MRLLIIDNYDSFTYNIVHAIRSLGIEPTIYRNDMIGVDDVAHYDKIIISPGPGIPSEAGIVPEMLQRYSSSKPILGICLGHQAIGECFGAKLKNLPTVYHGIKSSITIDKPDYMFDGLPDTIDVGRYHSWVVCKDGLPDCLKYWRQARRRNHGIEAPQLRHTRSAIPPRIHTHSRRNQHITQLDQPLTISH